MTESFPTLRHFVPKQARKRRKSSDGGFDDGMTQHPANPTLREQAIWRAVLMQAITDAFSNSHKPYARRCKREALAWLTHYSRDFRTVCDYAGYDPLYLHQKIAHLLQLQQGSQPCLPHNKAEFTASGSFSASATAQWQQNWPQQILQDC